MRSTTPPRSLWISHSQTVRVCQPAAWRSAVLRASRSMLRSNFACQNGVLCLGREVLHRGQRCQKQPCTKIARRLETNVMSGRTEDRRGAREEGRGIWSSRSPPATAGGTDSSRCVCKRDACGPVLGSSLIVRWTRQPRRPAAQSARRRAISGPVLRARFALITRETVSLLGFGDLLSLTYICFNEQRTTNNEQRTTINDQRTTNNYQRTAINGSRVRTGSDSDWVPHSFRTYHQSKFGRSLPCQLTT